MTDEGLDPVTAPWPEAVRKATVGGEVIGYGLAVAAFVLRLQGGDLSFLVELPGAISLSGLVAVPPTLAALSRKGRPVLLLPAGVLGIMGLLGLLSILGLPLAFVGFMWLWAYLRLGLVGRMGVKLGMTAVPILWLGALLFLYIHVDPYCEQRFENGSIEEVDPVARGFETGWIWDLDSSRMVSQGFSGDAAVVSESCDSDTVEVWEMAVSLGLAVLALGYAWRLAAPEPAPVGLADAGLDS